MTNKHAEENLVEPDFSDFFLAETASFEVKMPNGKTMMRDGKPVIVHVYGPGSEVYEKAHAEMTRAVNTRLMSNLASKDESNEQDDSAKNKEVQARFLTKVTERFENFPFPGGPAKIYTDRRLAYINSFVDRKLADLGNFLPGGKDN